MLTGSSDQLKPPSVRRHFADDRSPDHLPATRYPLRCPFVRIDGQGAEGSHLMRAPTALASQSSEGSFTQLRSTIVVNPIA
jgi:hypothetical protein